MTSETQTLDAPPSAAATAKLHARFFGRLGDLFGHRADIDIPLSGCALSTLMTLVAARVEGGAEALAQTGVRAAVDQELVIGHDPWVSPGQEVAFFSAFSGG